VVRVRMTQTPGLLERTFDAAVKLTSTVWPYVTVSSQPGYANYTRIDRWGQCDKILPHILSLKHVFSTYNFVADKGLTCRREFLLLLCEVGWYISTYILFLLIANCEYRYQIERANPASSIEATNFALDIIDQWDDDFRPIAAALHGNRQHAAFETNDPETCLHHAQQALNIQEELCAETGKKSGKLATALGEMGKACNRNQLPSKALEYYVQSREIREAQDGYHKLALFTCLLGTGHALWLLGRHEEASASVEEALKDRELAFGPDDKEGVRCVITVYIESTTDMIGFTELAWPSML